MEISLRSRRRKICFGLAALALLSLWWTWNLESYLASRYTNSQDAGALERATRLAPNDASYHYRLAQFHLLVSHNLSSAVSEYHTAVELNPYEASYWLGAATAYDALADKVHVEDSLRRAISADPTNPRVAWEAASFYFAMGQAREGLRQFRTVISGDPGLLYPALELAWRTTHNAGLIAREALPLTADAYLTFLQFLLTKKDSHGAAAVWDNAVALRQPLDSRQALPYVQYLIQRGEVDNAIQVWNTLAGASRDIHRLTSALASNLVMNNGFEDEVLNGGFDWRYDPRDHVAVSIDAHHSHSGCCALLMSFAGPPSTDAGISQFIPVQPNSRYEFTAYVKTDNLESAHGPRFYLGDAYTHARYFLTEDFLGTASWQQVHGTFETGPAAKLLFLTVMRIPDMGLIRGQFWIDDLALVRKP